MTANPQDDPQWKIDRCGSVGASEIADVMRRVKSGGFSATRASLMARKVCERLTGVPVETFKSRAMLDGIEREASARLEYELLFNAKIELVGVVPHPLVKGTHASPDGLVGNLGLVQFKCPEHAAHLEFILEERIDGDYLKQCQWEMACTGRHWDDFVSFNPDFPSAMQLVRKRIERDGQAINEMESEVRTFLKELEAKVSALRARYEPAEEAA